MTVAVVAATGGLMDIGTVSLHIASLWSKPVTVIEADPDGGRLAARHDWDVRPGLVELVTAARTAHDRQPQLTCVRRHGERVGVVVAPPAAEAVIATLPVLAERVAQVQELLGTDVIVNVGRVRPDSPAETLIARADIRILVTRTDLEDVVALVHRTEHLRLSGSWNVLTAGGRYKSSEVDRAVEWPVLADLLPDDPRSSSRLRQVIGQLAASNETLVSLPHPVVAS